VAFRITQAECALIDAAADKERRDRLTATPRNDWARAAALREAGRVLDAHPADWIKRYNDGHRGRSKS
jgi:hypothetical protein